MKAISCGVIPVKQENGLWFIFIIQHAAGHWGFPKGHLEDNESYQIAAERELLQETGFRVAQYLSNNPFTVQYSCISHQKHVDKTVIYYLAFVSGEIKLCPIEVDQGVWISIDQLEDKITFLPLKPILVELRNYLAIL